MIEATWVEEYSGEYWSGAALQLIRRGAWAHYNHARDGVLVGGKTGEMVGWLGATGQREANDGWVFWANRAYQVELPKFWGGELIRGLWKDTQIERQTDLRFLVGISGPTNSEGQPGTLVSACHPCAQPDLPELTKGPAEGVRGSRAKTRLGVIWVGGETGEKIRWGGESTALGTREPKYSPGEGGLAVAWGNGQGKFLGWELVASMKQAHRSKPGEGSRLVGLPYWNEIERAIRVSTWGREL